MNERLKEIINAKEYYDIIIGYFQGLSVNISFKNNVHYIFYNHIYKFLNNSLCNIDINYDFKALLELLCNLYDNIQIISYQFEENQIDKNELNNEMTNQIQNFINKYYEISE